MNYEVYSYWNLLELEGVFNAVAALTASSDFTGLLRVLALIVMITLALAVLAGRSRHEDFWRWVMMAAIVNGMLLVPKSTVTLIDRTGTEPNRVVANVPIGLAALAHGASKLGDWITRAYETVFSLPNDLQFQRRGLMFGHAVLTETQFLSPDMVSGAWMKDFQEFWRECVTPDIITGYLPIDTLRKTTDLWSAIGNTNPARYVTLSTVGTVSCHPAAYNDLGNRLNNSVVPALITSYGLKKFPNDPQAVTNAQNGIVAAYGYGPGISNTAQSIVRQAALQQAMVQAYCGVFAQSGDSNRAALCYSTAMGAYQTNQTYQVLAKIAESSMPKLKSAIEIIQYAIAPIIIAFAIVAAHLSLPVLKTYAMSLVWVQLWAPLYAVVHYIQTVKMQAYQAALGASAGTLEGSAQLVNMGVSDLAVAGMLVVAIPPIAAALVKGGEVGLQAVAGLVSAPRTAERQAADTAKGNEHIGDWNTAPTIRTGAPIHTAVGANGVNVTTFADGTTAVDASGMQHRMNLRLNAGSRMSAALQQQSEQAETAAIGNLVTAAATTAAALQQSADFVRTHARGERAGMHYGLGDQTGFSQAVNQTQKVVDSFAKKHGLDQTQAAQILGMAEASMQNPKALDLVSPLSVKAAARVTGQSEASAKQLLEEARNYAKETGFSEAVDKVRRATREATFDTSDEASRRAMEGIRASLDQSRQHTDQAAASHQQSLAFKEAATRARENSAAWETGMLRQFVDWMGTQRNEQDLLGRNFNAGAVAQMAEKNPELLTPFVERFFKERIEPTLSAGIGEVKTAGDVQAFFEHGKAAVPGANDIATQGKQWLGRVQGAAAHAGVDPRAGVSSQLPQQIVATQGQAEQAIGAGRGHVQTEGKPLEDKVRNQTAPGTQPLLGLAATNAAAQILPDGASRHMMERLPGIDMSVGTPGSAVAEAAAERARMGQPRDPVMQSVTNVAGAIDGALDRTIAYGKDKIGEVIGTQQPMTLAPTATSIGEVKTAGDGGDLLGGAWALGESKIGEMIGARPGTAPARPAPDGGESSPSDGNGSPPPSRR